MRLHERKAWAGFQAGNTTCKCIRTFAGPSVGAQLIAGLTGALVAAQRVQAVLLTAATVGLGALIFLYKSGNS